MARPHWDKCLVHFRENADELLKHHFGRENRCCVLIAGAGFDPRAGHVASALSNAMPSGLSAIFIREERGEAAANLRSAGDLNEAALLKLIPGAQVETIDIFSLTDQATVGGHRIVEILLKYNWPEELTDIVVDFSALSIGISFPAARFMVDTLNRPEVNVHFVIASNPDLESNIVGEPSSNVMAVRGFTGPNTNASDFPSAEIWMPHLVKHSRMELTTIQSSLKDLYKICPVLPFPAREPRRADELISEFSNTLLAEWDVAPRDFLYVSEWNPLDSYRAMSMLKKRYDRTVENVYSPRIVLSPIGSRVMGIGAMMAAIEHDLEIKYVEALRYDVKTPGALVSPPTDFQLVHIWADGPIYNGIKQ